MARQASTLTDKHDLDGTQWTRTQEPGAAIDAGLTLPFDWYRDPAILAREREAIFSREWLYVGHASLLPATGSYFTTMAGHIPTVVLRDAAGELRAYVNICAHRGHSVALGKGCSTSLQCLYHGWTYGLDGRLRAAPRSDREPSFPKTEIGLRPMQVACWGPLIFVNANLEAPPLSDALAKLPEIAKDHGLDFDALPLRATREWTIKANWKLLMDNATECYHCATVHPSFRRNYNVDRDSFRITAFDRSYMAIAPPKVTDADDPPEFHQYILWPSFAISARGTTCYYTYSWRPETPGTTLQVNDYFFPASYSDREVDEAVDEITPLMREDWQVYERIQIGIESGMIAHGQLLPEEEWLMRHDQRLCYEALTRGDAV